MKHEESKLQQACVKWFRLQYPMYARLLFAIPNGGARDKVTGSLLKAEGVVAGVPDLMLAKQKWTIDTDEGDVIHQWESNGLFIEMKAPGGKVTPRQAEMHKLLTAQGYEVAVCWSFDEFKQTIEDYLQ
jgi:hypothetical protein